MSRDLHLLREEYWPTGQRRRQRTYSRAEFEAMVAGPCREDDRRAAAEEAEWLRGAGLPYRYEHEDPSADGDTADVPFLEPRFLAGYGWGFGTAMLLALIGAMTLLGPLIGR